jgi:hypothetical protein
MRWHMATERQHDHIPDFAANIPVVTGVAVIMWAGDRFDELLLLRDGPA